MNARWASPSRQSVAFRHAVGIIMAAIISLIGVPAQAQQSQNSALLERGRYLVEDASACGLCHTPRGADGRAVPGKALSGGRVMANDQYRAVVPNITVDPETGLGRWSDLEIGTAIRDGRRPDGSLIGPPMPMEFYRGFSDRDVAAIVLYLRTAPAVRNAVERSTYPSALVPYGPPVTGVPDPPADDPVKRGAYLAGPVAHCLYCHTPPLPGDRRDWSRKGAGGQLLHGPWGVVVGRNITSSKEFGIGDWTDEEIIGAVTRSISRDGRQLAGPMSSRAPGWARLTDHDLHDLIAFLRSLPPQD